MFFAFESILIFEKGLELNQEKAKLKQLNQGDLYVLRFPFSVSSFINSIYFSPNNYLRSLGETQKHLFFLCS
jgi:hypothetical protein